MTNEEKRNNKLWDDFFTNHYGIHISKDNEKKIQKRWNETQEEFLDEVAYMLGYDLNSVEYETKNNIKDAIWDVVS